MSVVSGLAVCVVHAASLVLLAGCEINDPCYEHGFDEGERFRITVLAVRLADACDTPLKTGDSFTIVGGPAMPPDQCLERAANPETPPFAADLLMSCQPYYLQLGLKCTGTTPSGCAVSLTMSVAPHIARGIDVIERGGLSTTWNGHLCEPRACTAAYDVRIERLKP